MEIFLDFTTEYNMALDFAYKTGKYYGFVYKCLIKPKTPYITTEQEIMKIQFDFLNNNEILIYFGIILKQNTIV
jgi:hypothetical protein